MQIWLVPNKYFPAIGGVQTVVRDLAQTIKQNNHEVIILTSRLPYEARYDEHQDQLVTFRLSFPIIREDFRSKIIFIAKFLPTMLRLTKLYLQQRPDIVNIHYLDEHAFYIMILREIFKFPLILSLHGSDVVSNVVHSKTLLYTLKRLVDKAEYITTPSIYLKSVVKGICPDIIDCKYVVINNGIDFSTINYNSHTNSSAIPYIVAVGRLINEKGYDILLRAYKIVLDSGCNHQLVIIGDGSEKEKLYKLAQSLEIDDSVVFLGKLDHIEVYTRIKQSCFLVLPSRFEGFGIVLVEAMLHGKTVIASNVGGIPEIVENGVNGILFEIDDYIGLARELVGLIRNENKRQLLETAALRDSMKKYNNVNLHAQYLDIYVKTINKFMTRKHE